MNEKELLFNEFLKEYLENVKKELPQSYRARQLEAGGLAAAAVYEFETRFLKKPFEKAIKEAKCEILDDLWGRKFTGQKHLEDYIDELKKEALNKKEAKK